MAHEWTVRDIYRLFPSVEALIKDCGNKDRTHWGLRQHIRTKLTSFGFASLDWDLVLPLENIVADADKQYGNAPYNELVVCYFVCLMTPVQPVYWVLERIGGASVIEIRKSDPYRVIH